MHSRLLPLLLLPCLLQAEVFLRWNQAGYRPDRTKSLIAMSDKSLEGQAWTILRKDASGREILVLQGRFEEALTGCSSHSPLRYNHSADFTRLSDQGIYFFVTQDTPPARLRIAVDPYADLIELPLLHLQVMRSGTQAVRLREASHLKDARARMYVVRADPKDGKWTPAKPKRYLDALGGWYDAGDQIKFTLNNAYTSYHLLLAYSLDPQRFSASRTPEGLPRIIDEARHGLEFLMRCHPDRNTFIIQVGDASDHNEPARLPEHDRLDGYRPALSALSRVHLASASAALASGARCFSSLGRPQEAARYRAMAETLFARALESDTVQSAFERDEVNDFYHDPTDRDQLALAAGELHSLTGKPEYLEKAQQFAPGAADEVSWTNWNWLANARLAKSNSNAAQSLLAEVQGYRVHAREKGAPWGLPGAYIWGSLHRWTGAANASAYAARFVETSAEQDALSNDILDYVFGRNNWGVSFLFDERLPNTLRHLYSPAYRLLGAFPQGAFSEGPGDRKTHASLEYFFKTPPHDPFHRFNTKEGVFFDRSEDFMCQEATIGGQADLILLLTLASLPPPGNSSDSP